MMQPQSASHEGASSIGLPDIPFWDGFLKELHASQANMQQVPSLGGDAANAWVASLSASQLAAQQQAHASFNNQQAQLYQPPPDMGFASYPSNVNASARQGPQSNINGTGLFTRHPNYKTARARHLTCQDDSAPHCPAAECLLVAQSAVEHEHEPEQSCSSGGV
jgi:hypothetical protein